MVQLSWLPNGVYLPPDCPDTCCQAVFSGNNRVSGGSFSATPVLGYLQNGRNGIMVLDMVSMSAVR
ncbi:hypothetical Protein YC6258_05655 [Gynuella sunshinyii YC6258]|uniref:Uncharacterized protein n=1 Tax=Gynuella sunshinyii YC6258 TaxID=1445510 RepID=A0A0C5VWK3_9GAMM|nr:hypothetical Protein YC6258_05655 [Gynuella sunshinyii YC6258]